MSLKSKYMDLQRHYGSKERIEKEINKIIARGICRTKVNALEYLFRITFREVPEIITPRKSIR